MNENQELQEAGALQEEKESLKDFFENHLGPKLVGHHFTEEQISAIQDSVARANVTAKKARKKPSTKQEESIENSIRRFFKNLIEEPIELVKVLRGGGGMRLILDTSISFAIILALVYLAANKLLETSQTATLFGGIVGYLLGQRGSG